MPSPVAKPATKADVFVERMEMLNAAVNRLDELTGRIGNIDSRSAAGGCSRIEMTVADVLADGPQIIGAQAERINSLIAAIESMVF